MNIAEALLAISTGNSSASKQLLELTRMLGGTFIPREKHIQLLAKVLDIASAIEETNTATKKAALILESL